MNIQTFILSILLSDFLLIYLGFKGFQFIKKKTNADYKHTHKNIILIWALFFITLLVQLFLIFNK